MMNTFKHILIILFLQTIIFQSIAQKHTISGYIKDAESGEELIGANVFDKSRLIGSSSNTYGFYSLTLPADTYTIVFSYVGYKPHVTKLDLRKDVELNVELSPVIELDEVEVTATQTEKVEEMTKMSSIKIPVGQLKSIPALLGEVDVLKAIQLLPGVQSGVEGTSGIYVRGGGPDQNLILLDGTPVYNASHLFGFFSVFNADAIKNIELIKGGFPARYGGRLSSVMEINMKEGNMKEFSGEGTLGIIASKMTLEGPIKKDRASFIVSARRTYIDILAQPFIRMANNSSGQNLKIGYYFYDLNAKVNYKISSKDRLYLSAYLGSDKFYFKDKTNPYLYNGNTYTEEYDAGLGWGNITSALRWNHQFNNKLFGNLTLTYSQYQFDINNAFSETVASDTHELTEFFSVNYLSGINDWAAKMDFDFLPNPNHYIKFGVSAIYHTFKPGVTAFQYQSTNVPDFDSSFGANRVYATELAAYIEDDLKLTESLKVNFGLHYSGFKVKNDYYHSFQPRISARYLFDKAWSLKASYAHMQQYVHLLTNTNIGLPTDLWVPTTDNIKPQLAHQVAIGFAKSFKNNYQLTIEGYYKTMDNLLEYKEGATFINTQNDWEDKIETGKGWSYGIECFFEKKVGNTTGWIGYTLSWSNRQFANINFGEIYPYKYDRRHDISIVVSHQFNDEWAVSATWVYGTGNAVTLPVVRYLGYERDDSYFWGFWEYGNEVEYFEKKNDFRMASYHRLDVGASYNKKKDWGELGFNFGVYNAYSRKNPFFYYFSRDQEGNRVLKRVSLFPIIPSINFNIKF